MRMCRILRRRGTTMLFTGEQKKIANFNCGEKKVFKKSTFRSRILNLRDFYLERS